MMRTDLSELLRQVEEAQRQLTVCNACRYCEGYCAVFPALERRLVVEECDVLYLANLCHDCGACVQACPYSVPHEFAINIPMAMSGVRVRSYEKYTWPRRGALLFEHAAASAVLLTCAGAILAIATIIGLSGINAFVAADVRLGSFYRVVPWLAMLIPSLFATLFGLIVIVIGSRHFWKQIHARIPTTTPTWRHVWGAVLDAVQLRYLDGGGPGCYYPDRLRPSQSRRVFHHSVAFGFALCFASSAAAAIEQDILSILPPYPLISVPVVLGTIGGVAIVLGACGLLALKLIASSRRAGNAAASMDVSFMVLLLAASGTGLLLLALRGTSLMGIVLAAHLASLVALYVTFPYGKFVHAVYRFIALVTNRLEADVPASD